MCHDVLLLGSRVSWSHRNTQGALTLAPDGSEPKRPLISYNPLGRRMRCWLKDVRICSGIWHFLEGTGGARTQTLHIRSVGTHLGLSVILNLDPKTIYRCFPI